ncbi:putative protein without homology [Propionibacterium freudenreichii subsp. shermanii]|nr:putative protein without homology [Propionibacterium freudenreichii subsp. shermanii]
MPAHTNTQESSGTRARRKGERESAGRAIRRADNTHRKPRAHCAGQRPDASWDGFR